MITTPLFAWTVSIGITLILYFLTLAIIFKRVRAHQQLKKRWDEYGRNVEEKWESFSTRLEDKRLRSLHAKNRLKEFLAHPYPSFKMIEFLFYRSNFFPNIKVHIIGQVIGTIFLSDLIFVFYGFSIGRSFFLGLCISLLIHILLLRLKESAWQRSFTNIFPVSLDIINRGLKSGMSLGRGIAMVAEEVEDPVGNEFNYIASQLQIGISPTDALNEAASRIGVEEFRFFSVALNIQREMGGSLADILAKLSELIKDRERFRKKVWTLSSEGRATAVIVGSLPFFLAIMVELISPGYLKFFLTDPKGKMMLWVSLGLSLTGAIVITRMMRVES